jgi:hypothetical protein
MNTYDKATLVNAHLSRGLHADADPELLEALWRHAADALEQEHDGPLHVSVDMVAQRVAKTMEVLYIG